MASHHRNPQQAFHSIGLDFSARVARYAFIERSKKQYIVRSASELRMPKGVIENGVIQDTARAAAVMKEMVADSRRHHLPKYVSAALPDQQCYVFTMTLSSTNSSERAEAIRWEASQHIPFTVDELYYDSQILEEHDGVATVQVAAAPKAVVDGYVAAIEQANLVPLRLEVASLAALRTLASPAPERPYLCCVFEWSTTTLLSVTPKGVPMTIVTPTFSGERLTNILAEKLKLKPSEAEKAKNLCGLDPSMSQGVVRHAMWPEWKLLLEEIHRLQDYAPAQTEQSAFTDIVLTGSQSMVRSLKEELRLKTHCTIHENPLRPEYIFDADRNHPALRPADLAGFTSVLGLATPLV